VIDNHPAERVYSVTESRLRFAIQQAHQDFKAEQPLVGPGRVVTLDEWTELIVQKLVESQ
jgi:hypothetical protein